MARVILAVTNDLVADQRIHRIATTLVEMGFDVLVIGRQLKKSSEVNRNYKTLRFKLLFKRSWLFYANYNFRLFLYLLFQKKLDLVVANDVDTLVSVKLAADFRCKPTIFDAHEYFTEVPELIDKPRIKSIWLLFEKLLVPEVTKAYTVCNSLSNLYNEKYKTSFAVVRNLPHKLTLEYSDLLKQKFPGKKIILYQGSVNKGRGLELVINSMELIENTVFVIIGDGDIRLDLEHLVSEKALSEKVFFLGRIPFESLPEYTLSVDVGISLEEDLGLNYRYALPNKIFDYIQARVPVLVSDLPEMRSIAETYHVGCVLKDRSCENVASVLNDMLHNKDQRITWDENLKKAANELCWENEKQKIVNIYKEFL